MAGDPTESSSPPETSAGQAPADRALRLAPPQAEFDRLVIPPAPFALDPAYRLANVSYPSQFYANPRSRLTPWSRRFPCVYLAASWRTAVAEVWGDRMYAQRRLGRAHFTIDAGEANQCRFLKLSPLPPWNLCNLTAADVRDVLGLESGTLYSPDLALPRTWAERIANHPARFDGILYTSRHTEEKCVVVWQRPGEPEPAIPFIDDGPFLGCPDAYALAARNGLRLSFV